MKKMIFILLILFTIELNAVEKNIPTWLSVFVPGLGDYMNNNPKLGMFWFGSTAILGVIHYDSVTNLRRQKNDYLQALDFGLFYQESSAWTLFTYSKFWNERENYKEAYRHYKQTGNILITWWLLNALSAQINYPRLFEVLNKKTNQHKLKRMER